MRVLIQEGENQAARYATMKELLDALLVEACGRGDAETEDHGVEEALAIAGKVDELAGKVAELEGRLHWLEVEADR